MTSFLFLLPFKFPFIDRFIYLAKCENSRRPAETRPISMVSYYSKYGVHGAIDSYKRNSAKCTRPALS